MQFGILGPLEVRSGPGVIAIPGAKQRAILSTLLLHPREVVSVDRLLEWVWGDHQPANPKNALQSQIAELRRLLGDDRKEMVVARAPGYVLDVDPAAIDAVRFEGLVAEGRSALGRGAADHAAEVLRTAAELWRGPPLADVAGAGFADMAITRLEEMRVGALEDRIECDLRSGRHRGVIGELEGLVSQHPTRERLRGQLMMALTRDGRQAEALALFDRTREMLVEELGVDPGPELQQVYETILSQDDVVSSQPALRESNVGLGPDALPELFTDLVGRDDDLERVIALIGGCRLVTLTGPGGVGKTRLAVEAARRMRAAEDGPDSAWMVELDQLDRPEQVWEAIADVVGVSSAGTLVGADSADARTRTIGALRRRRAVLLFDNCEHLVDGVAEVAIELLERTERVTVLATSREALAITGEAVWSVTSLLFPAEGAPLSAEPSGWSAVELFVSRASRADPGFVADKSTLPLVAEVCRRLDGIPLALELAAARVRTLGLTEVAARLRERPSEVTGGSRAAPPRHRTMRAALEWSWDLLDEVERTLFRRVSIFAGPATLSAIEEVCTDDLLSQGQVPELVASLADKSLLSVLHNDPVRYRMLNPLRVYAGERLEESGESESVARRHADHVLSKARQLVSELRGQNQAEAMIELDGILDDVRAATRNLESMGAAASGAELVVALGWYWYLRGRRTEALRLMSSVAPTARPREAALIGLWTDFFTVVPTADRRDLPDAEEAVRLLGEFGSVPDRTLGTALASVIAGVRGDPASAARHLREAARLATQTDAAAAALVDLLTGNQYIAAADTPRAERVLHAALARFAELGDRWGQVQSLAGLVACAQVRGDTDTAMSHAASGIELAAQLGLTEMEVILRCRYADLAVQAGDFEEAARAVDEARALADELGSDIMAHNVSLAAGHLALRDGRLVNAEHEYRRVLEWLGDSPFLTLRSHVLTRLGTVAELRGDLEQAEALHDQAHEAATTSSDAHGELRALAGKAATTAAAGRLEEAAARLGARSARCLAAGLPPLGLADPEADRAERLARAGLGDDAFEAAFEAGSLLLDGSPRMG